jgi:hypothetical protein
MREINRNGPNMKANPIPHPISSQFLKRILDNINPIAGSK